MAEIKIIDAIFSIGEYDDSAVICARRPFVPDNEATIAHFNEDFSIPLEIRESGFDYFLAKDGVLELLDMVSEKVVTLQQKAEFVCYYADKDAYPDWYFDLPDAK